MRRKISALTNHVSKACCCPLNLFRLNQFEVGFPLLVILLKEWFQSHSNGCYPYQVSRHTSVKDLFYIQKYVGNGLVQPHLTCLTYSCLRLLSLSSHCIQLMYTICIVVSQLQYKEWLTMVVAMTLHQNLSQFVSLSVTIVINALNLILQQSKKYTLFL